MLWCQSILGCSGGSMSAISRFPNAADWPEWHSSSCSTRWPWWPPTRLNLIEKNTCNDAGSSVDRTEVPFAQLLVHVYEVILDFLGTSSWRHWLRTWTLPVSRRWGCPIRNHKFIMIVEILADWPSVGYSIIYSFLATGIICSGCPHRHTITSLIKFAEEVPRCLPHSCPFGRSQRWPGSCTECRPSYRSSCHRLSATWRTFPSWTTRRTLWIQPWTDKWALIAWAVRRGALGLWSFRFERDSGF